MNYAMDPQGMTKLVEADRWQEYRASRTGAFTRSLTGMLHRRPPALTAKQIHELEALRRARDTREDSPAVLATDSTTPQPVRTVAGGGQ
jgi:hypothetical protein